MTDSTNLIRIVQAVQPDEIYNLAAQSHVQVSFETPEYTANADALGALRILEAIRILGLVEKTRFYQASTSELYGKARRLRKRNHALLSAQPLRRGQALCLLDYGELPRGIRHACLERHSVQSREPHPRRDLRHRKITRAVAGIHLGVQEDALYRQSRLQARLGPCARLRGRHVADRAAGYADDYVLATGETHSVREFIELAFSKVGRKIEWKGKGIDEVGIDSASGEYW
jgi:GDPmannose 4,6-dehydratase